MASLLQLDGIEILEQVKGCVVCIFTYFFLYLCRIIGELDLKRIDSILLSTYVYILKLYEDPA